MQAVLGPSDSPVGRPRLLPQALLLFYRSRPRPLQQETRSMLFAVSATIGYETEIRPFQRSSPQCMVPVPFT